MMRRQIMDSLKAREMNEPPPPAPATIPVAPTPLCSDPEIYLVLEDPNPACPSIHLLVSYFSFTAVSCIFQDTFYMAAIHDRKVPYQDRNYFYLKYRWLFCESLLTILRVIHYVPDAFPEPSEMTFQHLMGIAITLDAMKIDLIPWFRPYFEYWRAKKMDDGYEQWLVVGKAFEDKEGYAKLTARMTVEFLGWGCGRLVGLKWRPDPSGFRIIYHYGKGRAPVDVIAHMEKEQRRLESAIVERINAWYRYIVHLRTSNHGRCTCSPFKDCVVVAKGLCELFKEKRLIPPKNECSTYARSILEIRMMLQDAEVSLKSGGGFGQFRDCKVHKSMMKLIRDVDLILETVNGITYDGEVETFGIRELCPKELVTPLTTMQLGLGAAAIGLAAVGAGLGIWCGFKMFLKGACSLDKVISK